jgi:hypothetical protein
LEDSPDTELEDMMNCTNCPTEKNEEGILQGDFGKQLQGKKAMFQYDTEVIQVTHGQ